MSARDLMNISAVLKRIELAERGQLEQKSKVELLDLPDHILVDILFLCDQESRDNALMASSLLRQIWDENVTMETESKDCNDNYLTLDCLPVDVLVYIFKFLDLKSLGRIAQVSRQFRTLAYTECLWIRTATRSLASNQLHPASLRKSQAKMSARDRVRVGLAWSKGECAQNILTVHNIKYMPRLQLQRDKLWVSWGKTIWCHPRVKNGGIRSTTTKMLRGPKDDVSSFVVNEGSGVLVCGARDKSIFGWDAATGDYLFSRRYCHSMEVSAVDTAGYGGSLVVSGSRDATVAVWAREMDKGNLLLLANQVNVGDRVWSIGICQDTGMTAVGTGARFGTPPLRILDLGTGEVILDMGSNLKNGAGMLDTQFLNCNTILSCGYDTCARLWDTRIGRCVTYWVEPYDETVYSLGTDRVNTLVTGTSMYGRVRVWDMRSTKSLYCKYSTPARRGQSSPIYSLAMDSSNIYVALDQSLNHYNFNNN
eukprot:TRINITY_DN3943_c0_g1_i1.p1 TRINITY_DN3943_c0_g1~~TRINITY_DN3943_c0_g1_i1.p1  ORF type:complete len:481 (+),score=108.66 TRINITY_DN3943_c0_g1_i1:386-1828(+)